MSARRPARPTRRNQRGVVNLVMVLFLLTTIAAVLGTALVMSASDITDSSEQNNSVQALLLAESGLERAFGRMALGTVCTALSPDAVAVGGGTVTLLAAGWDLVNPTWCRVRVAATVGRSTRTVDGWFAGGGGTIVLETWDSRSSGASSANTITIPNLVVAGPGRVLVVGVTVDTPGGSAVTAVRYAGQLLTQQIGAGSSSRPRAEIWTLANPPAGTGNVVVTLSGSDQLAAGAMVFTGVDTTTATSHLDVGSVSNTGNSNTASVTLTPVTNGAWVVDTVSVNSGELVTMTVAAGQLQSWNFRLGTAISSAGSTLGAINPASARTLQWTWGGGNERWSQVAIALRPGGTPQLVRWTEVVQ